MEIIDNEPNEIHVVDEQGEVGDGLQEISAKSQEVQRYPKLEVDEEKGISWAWTEVGFSAGKITRYVYGDKLIVNMVPVSKTTKTARSYKFKACIVLSVTSQLSGSLMAVSKQGSVQALSYGSAVCNTAGFLSSVGALWLWRTRPKLASALEVAGWGFAVCGFLGMMANFLL